MTLRTPTGPIGAILESLVAPSLPSRSRPGRALGGNIRALGAPVRVPGPLLGYRGIYHEGRGGAKPYFFPGAHSGCVRPCTERLSDALDLP